MSKGPSRVRAVSAIVTTDLRRMGRDRTSLFFIIVLPVVIIVVVGATMGANKGRLPVGILVAEPSAQTEELVAAFDAAGTIDLVTYDDESTLRQDIRSGTLVGGVVVPVGFGERLVAADGGARLVVLTGDPQSGQTVGEIVRAGADELGIRYAAQRFALDQGATDQAQVDAAVDEVMERIASIEVTARSVGVAPLSGTDNQFAYTAPSNLVLFVFINSLAIGGALIETRRLGVARRMVAAPITVATVLVGAGAARFAFALLQSALIIGIGRLLFGVSWGQTVAVVAVVVSFSLVGTGAGLLVGALARNAEQAQAVGIPVAIGLAMLGGCMWPLEVVSPPLQVIGHLTPHAWAMDAWVALIFEGRSLTAVWRELGVLLAYALVLIGVAVWALRRRLLA